MENILINLEENFYRKYFKKDIVSLEEILDKIEEFDDELEYIKEAYEKLEANVRDNYRPIPVSEQVGISDRDFI